MEKINVKDLIKTELGSVYICRYPINEVVRITGHTNKMIIAEKVPTKLMTMDGTISTVAIDQEWLKTNPVIEIKTKCLPDEKFKVCFEKDEMYLKRKKHCYWKTTDLNIKLDTYY